MSVKLSSRMQKRLLTQLQAMQVLRNMVNPRHSGQLLLKPVMIDDRSKKGESQARRAVVQNIDNRQGETGKVNDCFTLLKRITGLKCVNSEIKSNVKNTAWKGIPRRVPTILSSGQEGHTCIEKLSELLIWNVSCVQNNNRKRYPSKE